MFRQRAQIPPPPGDPALAALADASPGSLLLHSGRHHPRWSRRSLLATPQAWFSYTADYRSHLIHAHTGQPLTPSQPLTHNLWADLRHLLNDPRFPGRWFGYLSYDLAPIIEPTKLRPAASTDWPLVELAWCPDVTEIPSWECGVRNAELPELRTPNSVLHTNLRRPAYETAVRRALDYIAAGDIFQVNVAQQFSTTYHGNTRKLFSQLALISPAWYGAYLELCSTSDATQRTICSTSPELFLELNNDHVVTRPIKGTRPASHPSPGMSASESPEAAVDPNLNELAQSHKDTAELNMIVDLMRNDLGRVCAYGSVQVTSPRTIESHPTVHHGVATIEGTLHPSKDIVDLLRATLPGGSVTGAPKVRAMQIIAELEPTPRGPYTGAIGYLAKNEACLSVAIRTILLTPTPNSQPPTPSFLATFSVGSGIVADSDPAAEYEETLTKAQAMMHAFAIAGKV